MHPDHIWSCDFVHDQAIDGRRLRCLTVVDEFIRESLAIVIPRSLTSHDVIRALETLIGQRGRPECLRGDPGAGVHCRDCQGTDREAIHWHPFHRSGQSLAECPWREFQLDFSNDMPESLGIRIGAGSPRCH